MEKEKNKMCPNCKVELEELSFDVSASCSSSISKEEIKAKKAHGFNILDYDIDCLTDGVKYNNFRCPECDKEICDTEKEAMGFLK